MARPPHGDVRGPELFRAPLERMSNVLSDSHVRPPEPWVRGAVGPPWHAPDPVDGARPLTFKMSHSEPPTRGSGQAGSAVRRRGAAVRRRCGTARAARS